MNREIGSVENRGNGKGCFAVILAAGASRRMRCEKARLPWLDGKPLLVWMMERLSASGWRPIVVLGPGQIDDWSAVLPGEALVLNPAPERGKTTSLAAGAQRVSEGAEWILITAVDQPRTSGLYGRLLSEAKAAGELVRVLIPERCGSRGHPVVLSGALRERLQELDEGSLGLRGLLEEYADATCLLPGCDPEELQWDLNLPEDYAAARVFFGSVKGGITKGAKETLES